MIMLTRPRTLFCSLLAVVLLHSPPVVANVKYPDLKLLSENSYIWDDSLSEALNIARMAEPAGVGNGMMDYSDGTKATTGRIGAGARFFDGALGLASQGLFGVFAMESLSGGVNRLLDWKPSLVNVVPSHEVFDGKELSFLKVRNIVSAKIIDALKTDFPDIDIGLVLTNKNAELVNATVVIKGSICKDNMNFFSINKKHKGYVDFNYKKFYVDGPDLAEKHCALAVKIEASRLYNDSVVIVSEIISGHYFNQTLVDHFDGYVIVPDYFEMRASDSAKGIVIKTDYAFVSKAGKQLLFQKPMSSSEQ